MNTFNRIAIIGLGYIGLPAAVAFARCGKSVLGVDINPDVVTKINQGRIHFVEPQLEEAVKQAVE
ncbi:NAD-binding protein, partial [Actinobacillus pleuropneumoniae]